MQKALIIFILIFSVLFISAPAFAADTEVDVYVNGEIITTDQPAVIARGRTLVPLRAICEALNCHVEWIADEQLAKIQNEVTVINVKVMNDILKKVDIEDENNVKELKLDVFPVIYNDRVMVPARAISEALHAIVEWDASRKRVNITLEFDYISDFNEYGLAEVKKNGKYGYINKNRETVVDVAYENIGGFSEGFVIARKDGKWGCVDVNGNVTVPFDYDIMWGFADGFAVVGKGKKFGHIDKSGNEVVPTTYDLADNFSEGMARVVKGDQWGYVNIKGEVVIPFIYDRADSFFDGKAFVEKDGNYFYIDMTGKKVLN